MGHNQTLCSVFATWKWMSHEYLLVVDGSVARHKFLHLCTLCPCDTHYWLISWRQFDDERHRTPSSIREMHYKHNAHFVRTMQRKQILLCCCCHCFWYIWQYVLCERRALPLFAACSVCVWQQWRHYVWPCLLLFYRYTLIKICNATITDVHYKRQRENTWQQTLSLFHFTIYVFCTRARTQHTAICNALARCLHFYFDSTFFSSSVSFCHSVRSIFDTVSILSLLFRLHSSRWRC